MNTATVSNVDALAERAQAEAAVLDEIWLALQSQLQPVGFDNPAGQSAEFGLQELRRDPFDGSDALYSEWRGLDGRRVGNALIRADGNIYAELDVVKPHPSDERWFVEGVSAWGKRGAIKTELKLLPALGA